MKNIRCPICGIPITGQPAEWPDYPFCSGRCRKIDLGRWLGEKYGIPAEEQPPTGNEPKNDEE